jgi:beta-galactosidase
MMFGGRELETQYGVIRNLGAGVLNRFDNGLPAVTSNRYGSGEAVLLNFEASRMTYASGNDEMEKIITYYTLGDIRPPYEVTGASGSTVMRRSAPQADHYFILNDGPEESIRISSGVITYSSARNVITGEALRLSGNSITVKVPERSGTWIRAEKTTD